MRERVIATVLLIASYGEIAQITPRWFAPFRFVGLFVALVWIWMLWKTAPQEPPS